MSTRSRGPTEVAEAAAPPEQEAAGWCFDLACGHRALATTGGSTWAAAYLLADFLETTWPELGLGVGGKILELGSGTGWLGITLARNRPEIGELVLTEQGEGGAMEWLDDNVREQREAGIALANLRTQELDWLAWASEHGGAQVGAAAEPPERHSSELEGRQWDLLLGSDLVYNEMGVRLLPRVIRALLQTSSCGMLYAHTLHRFDHFDLDFFRELRAQGLQHRLVAWDGAQGGAPGDPLDDDGFLEELFPEQRIGIFHIAASASGPLSLQPRPVCSVAAGAVAAIEAARDGRGVAAQARDAEAEEEDSGGDEGGDDGAASDKAAGRVRLRAGLCLVLPDGIPLPPDELRPGEQVLSLPALGPFGSGNHPTTRLMLDFLVSPEGRERVGAAAAVCDFGCGSGVLGLGALALGAPRAVGVDLDPAALAAAAANALANGAEAPTAPAHRLVQARQVAVGKAALPAPCGGRKLELHLPPGEFLQRDLDFYCRFGDWQQSQATDGWTPLPPGGEFDLVLANIVVGPLCRVAPVVAGLLARKSPGGRGGEVLLAGFRKGLQTQQVEEAYGAQGLKLEALRSSQGWALMRARWP